MTLQCPPYKEEHRRRIRGQFCCYRHITCLSIIATGVKTTMMNLKLQKELKLNSLQLLKLEFGQNIIVFPPVVKSRGFLMIMGYL